MLWITWIWVDRDSCLRIPRLRAYPPLRSSFVSAPLCPEAVPPLGSHATALCLYRLWTVGSSQKAPEPAFFRVFVRPVFSPLELVFAPIACFVGYFQSLGGSFLYLFSSSPLMGRLLAARSYPLGWELLKQI